MPTKYTVELKQRAVELVLHAQADPVTARGAVTRIADELGVSKETLRVWVRTHKQSGTDTPAESMDLETENRRLRAELAEAKRANDILKKPSADSTGRRNTPFDGGVQLWRRRIGSRGRTMCTRVRGGSGVRIGRCGPRCARPAVRNPRGRCSVGSGA